MCFLFLPIFFDNNCFFRLLSASIFLQNSFTLNFFILVTYEANPIHLLLHAMLGDHDLHTFLARKEVKKSWIVWIIY